MITKIKEFEGEYRWLSNFWISPFNLNGKHYRSVEHFYQASKATNDQDHEYVRMLFTPNQTKKAGKTIQCRQDWATVKNDIMRIGVWEKFKQNNELREKLIATGDAILEEGNWWNDLHFGIDNKTGKGENWLGKILMETREKIKNENP